MANYILGTFPQDQFTFRLYDNKTRKTWQKIQSETGCYGIMNMGYFNFSDFKTATMTMMAGTWHFKPAYSWYGILIDKNGKLTVGLDTDATYDYMCGCPTIMYNGEVVGSHQNNKNGSSYTGVKPNGDVVCLLASKDNGLTTTQCVNYLKAEGCTSIFRWDGSWSSQGCLGPNKIVKPSQTRIVRTYMLIFKKGGNNNQGNSQDSNNQNNNNQNNSQGGSTVAYTPVNKTYEVYNCSSLNIRSGPGTSYTCVGGYAKGTKVKIVEKTGTWGRVDGKQWWVSMNYLKEVNTTTSSGTTAWDKATSKGIFGTSDSPTATMTKQELANALDKVGLL